MDISLRIYARFLLIQPVSGCLNHQRWKSSDDKYMSLCPLCSYMYALVNIVLYELPSGSYSVEHSTSRDSSYSCSLWIYECNEMSVGIFGHSEMPPKLPELCPAHHEAGDIFLSPD